MKSFKRQGKFQVRTSISLHETSVIIKFRLSLFENLFDFYHTKIPSLTFIQIPCKFKLLKLISISYVCIRKLLLIYLDCMRFLCWSILCANSCSSFLCYYNKSHTNSRDTINILDRKVYT